MAGAKLVIYIENVSPSELDTREPIGTGQSNQILTPTSVIFTRQTCNNSNDYNRQGNRRKYHKVLEH